MKSGITYHTPGWADGASHRYWWLLASSRAREVIHGD